MIAAGEKNNANGQALRKRLLDYSATAQHFVIGVRRQNEHPVLRFERQVWHGWLSFPAETRTPAWQSPSNEPFYAYLSRSIILADHVPKRHSARIPSNPLRGVATDMVLLPASNNRSAAANQKW